MDYFVYDPNVGQYNIAVLVKDTAYENQRQIDAYYTRQLEKRGIPAKDLVVVKLPYNQGKPPTATAIAAYLDETLPLLIKGGVKTLFVCDAHYFKALAKTKTKADNFWGYAMPCQAKGGEGLTCILGLNYNALVKNPNQESKLWMGLDTMADWIKGQYTPVGDGIIHSAQYPMTEEAIEATLGLLHKHPVLTVDIETFGLHVRTEAIGTIAFAWSQHEGIAFPVDSVPNGNETEKRRSNARRTLLKRFFTEYKGELVFHNAAFDVKHLIYNLWMKDPLDTEGLLEGLETLFTDRLQDTRLIAYLALNNTQRADLSLKTLAQEFAGNYAVDVKDISQQKMTDLLEYNLVDCLSTMYVYNKYKPVMIKDQQEVLYNTLFKHSLKPIIQMELTGMPVDVAKVRSVAKTMEEAIEYEFKRLNSNPYVQTAMDTIRQKECDKVNAKLKVKVRPIEDFDYIEFNPNSSQHLSTLLYDVMDFPVLDVTKTGAPAVGKNTLAKLKLLVSKPEQQELLEALMEYSAAQKIDSAFIPAFMGAWLKDDGAAYLHGSFHMGGTVSGRMSSSDPNMTNLPSGSQYGKLIKDTVRAPKGWVFCGADFASLEDRINALVTKDPNKLKVYEDQLDGHSFRAQAYWPQEMPDIRVADSAERCFEITIGDQTILSKSGDFILTSDGKRIPVEEFYETHSGL